MALTLLPAVDVRDGKAVRLRQGESGSETDYGSPLDAARTWVDAGAQWIHLVDLDAAFGTGDNRAQLRRIVAELGDAVNIEMSGGVRNVFVEDCDYAGYCKRGIYIKTNPDRGGFVKNLYVRNCVFDEVEDLFYVTSKYAGEGLDNNHFSVIENLVVDGLKCRKVSKAALVLQGTSEQPVTNVRFDNIEVGEAKTGISFSDTRNVGMGECHIGGKVDVPTQVTSKDNLFNR